MESILQYLNSPYVATLTGAAAVATAVYWATRPSGHKAVLDLDHQSEELDDKLTRVSRLIPRGQLMAYIFEDAQTIYECMLRGERVSENGHCMGWRPSQDEDYRWIRYRDVIEKSKNFGAGLLHNKLKAHSFVGIYSQNSVECVVAEHACYSQSMVIVPLYDTLGPDACTLIINEAEISLVVCDKEEKVIALIDEAPQTPSLRVIVAVDEISQETKDKARTHGIEVVPFADVEQLGKKLPVDPVPPRPGDLATVCYTSGTTGSPKGVMLTHANVIANVGAVLKQLGDVAPCRNDVMLSFLPLAHMFERCCQVAMYMVGGRVGFFGGSIKNLSEDFKALKPTVIPCVPRLLNKIYSKVQETVNKSHIKKTLLHVAMHSKKSELHRNVVRNNSFWDWFVFRSIQENLGGRVRLIVVGSAPLAGHILTFLRCALGCMIVEGYGQTECVAPCTLTLPWDINVDHVGPPIPSCTVKLVDVPDMNYFSSQGKGEVCVKGLTVFKGYLKDQERTEASLDKDGWLHTGDIGMWLPNGTLTILDRKKHIFKLAQGEYVVPEKIENIYIRCPLIAQVFVHGESLKSCLVGIVVPECEAVEWWYRQQGLPPLDWNSISENKDLKKMLLTELTTVGRNAGLKSFEQVKDIYVSAKPFTVDNNILTPTLKTRRKECKQFFASQIEAMYSTLA